MAATRRWLPNNRFDCSQLKCNCCRCPFHFPFGSSTPASIRVALPWIDAKWLTCNQPSQNWLRNAQPHLGESRPIKWDQSSRVASRGRWHSSHIDVARVASLQPTLNSMISIDSLLIHYWFIYDSVRPAESSKLGYGAGCCRCPGFS